MEKDSEPLVVLTTVDPDHLNPNGWRRIRTFEVVDNRFTVCPLWPLGNTPKKMELVIGVEPTTC